MRRRKRKIKRRGERRKSAASKIWEDCHTGSSSLAVTQRSGLDPAKQTQDKSTFFYLSLRFVHCISPPYLCRLPSPIVWNMVSPMPHTFSLPSFCQCCFPLLEYTSLLQCQPGTSWPPTALPSANFFEYLSQALGRGTWEAERKA